MLDKEMIDRVSKAILETPNSSDYETLVAINAIKAMREPTDKMVEAGKYAYIHGSADSYRAMIDCILND